MRDFEFSIATTADDAEILELLRDNPVPGPIAISYERYPSYFHGCGIMGDFHQTVIARHRADGILAGLACRAIRPMYINGGALEIGYLGQLRVAQRFQAHGLVTSGFRFFRDLDRDQRANGYITTIIEGNHVAQRVLVGRKSTSVPIYREIDRLYTLALPARAYKHQDNGSLQIHQATDADLSDLIRFLNSNGAEKQFFPLLREEHFCPGSLHTRDLHLADFLVAKQGNELCGVIGLWDQSAFKQPVVRRYSGLYRWGRHLYNGIAHIRGNKPLPPPGEALSVAYAAFTCVADNAPDIFDQLLRRLCTLAAERGYGRVLIGLTERDPLLAVARRFPHVPYVSRLYTVCWKERKSELHDLDHRINHVEIATI